MIESVKHHQGTQLWEAKFEGFTARVFEVYPPEVEQFAPEKFSPNRKVFQPSFFRGELLNFGRVTF